MHPLLHRRLFPSGDALSMRRLPSTPPSPPPRSEVAPDATVVACCSAFSALRFLLSGLSLFECRFRPSSARLRSWNRSSASSNPTESRSRSPGTPESGPSTVARCSMRLSTPPREVAGAQILSRDSRCSAASAPPATRMDNMPPNMVPAAWLPDCCATLTACIGWVMSPGYRTCVILGCAWRRAARVRAESLCRLIRMCSVRMPRSRSHASKAPSTAPPMARARFTASHASLSTAATMAPAMTSE
mmetsp:Transcript_36858/g.91727  ORF Transcript_36858/g.91727 Transcript_36858/m.91727 type:complete len:245 (+) Transcript_36858:275-1009(+)